MNDCDLLAQHDNAFAIAQATCPAWVHLANSLIGRMLEKGASFPEAKIILQSQCMPALATSAAPAFNIREGL